jgi:hypothetical protein
MKLSLAASLACSAVLLCACGSGTGLIPEVNAGPLRSDFEAVAIAAENGHGSCSTTSAALARTQSDFNKLPASVNAQLRAQLSKGISHLESQALKLCLQPASTGATTTATGGTSSKTSSLATSTTTSTTTATSSEEEPVSTSSTTSSTAPGAVGGAEAPGGGQPESNPGGNAAEGEGK